MRLQNHNLKAHKKATIWYSKEVEKGKEGMSTREICETANETFDINLFYQSIQHYIKNGLSIQFPLKKGTPGDIPNFIYSTISSAIESHMNIN